MKNWVNYDRREFIKVFTATPILAATKNQAVLDGTRENCEFCGRPTNINVQHPVYKADFPEGAWYTCEFALQDFLAKMVPGTRATNT